jgi:hypothetical protein
VELPNAPVDDHVGRIVEGAVWVKLPKTTVDEPHGGLMSEAVCVELL